MCLYLNECLFLSACVFSICTCWRVYSLLCDTCACLVRTSVCVCVSHRIRANARLYARLVFFYSGPNQTHACCTGLMNTNRRERRKRGQNLNVREWLEMKTEKMEIKKGVEGGRMDKGEWRTDRENMSKEKTTTWVHPPLSLLAKICPCN